MNKDKLCIGIFWVVFVAVFAGCMLNFSVAKVVTMLGVGFLLLSMLTTGMYKTFPALFDKVHESREKAVGIGASDIFLRVMPDLKLISGALGSAWFIFALLVVTGACGILMHVL